MFLGCLFSLFDGFALVVWVGFVLWVLYRFFLLFLGFNGCSCLVFCGLFALASNCVLVCCFVVGF